MTTASVARIAPAVLAAGTERTVATVSERLIQVGERFLAYRETLADLRALTGRQLSDVGMTRATLKETARRAVYGQ